MHACVHVCVCVCEFDPVGLEAFFKSRVGPVDGDHKGLYQAWARLLLKKCLQKMPHVQHRANLLLYKTPGAQHLQ